MYSRSYTCLLSTTSSISQNLQQSHSPSPGTVEFVRVCVCERDFSMQVFTALLSKYHNPLCNPYLSFPQHTLMDRTEVVIMHLSFTNCIFSIETELFNSAIFSIYLWHFRFMSHMGFGQGMQFDNLSRREDESKYHYLPSLLLGYWFLNAAAGIPWLMSSPNMLAGGGLLQLHRRRSPDI